MEDSQQELEHAMKVRLHLLLTKLVFLCACAGVAQMESRAAEPKPAPVKQIIVVFKTHFDIGYTDMAANIVARYRTTMIDKALEVVDQNRGLPPAQQFAWTVPGWPMHQILDWPEQDPARKHRVEAALEAGRFVVHALPFSTHTELLEPEDLVRGLGHSSRITRGLGLPLPRDAKMTDVPCHSWVVPTLLSHAGVKFLHLGCNSASSSPRVPALFWWEGPDGSRLLTYYSAGGYGSGLTPPGDWPHQTWLALIHTGDNHGPPAPAEVKTLLERAAKELPGVDVRIGRLSDFADALLAEEPDLPVVRGDMPDTWIHGPMSDPIGAKLARNIRPAISTTEALATQLEAWAAQSSTIGPVVAAAYEKSLLYGEHTWGGALYWITPYGKDVKWGYGDVWKAERAAGRFQKLEDSWAEHTAYIESAWNTIAPELEKNLKVLAHGVNTDGRRFVVYNPLPWKRDGLVSLKGESICNALRPMDGGEVVPVESRNGELRFVARDVPAMGYRSYGAVKAELAPSALSAEEKRAMVESPYFKAVLDPAHGAVSSLIDKRSGRELVDRAAPHALGQYLYERFDSRNSEDYVASYVKLKASWAVAELGKPNLPPVSEVPYRAASPENCSLRIESSPVSVIASLHSGASPKLPHAVTTRLILYAAQPFADLEVTVHDKAADPWPEAGWICLPFRIDSPQFRLGRLGSIVDPARDLIAGANHDLCAVNTGLTIRDAQGNGVGLCALDSPLVSLDRPGLWKYEPDFVPRRPAAYFNLFNNQWTTNFRYWNEGSWTSRVRVWTCDSANAERSLVTPSLEARYPLLAAEADGPSGKLAPLQRGLELSRKGVLVTAFGPNPDGPGTVLRLWELSGESSSCRVKLPAGLRARRLQAVNLRGEAVGEKADLCRGEFSVDLRAFAPASFVMTE